METRDSQIFIHLKREMKVRLKVIFALETQQMPLRTPLAGGGVGGRISLETSALTNHIL